MRSVLASGLSFSSEDARRDVSGDAEDAGTGAPLPKKERSEGWAMPFVLPFLVGLADASFLRLAGEAAAEGAMVQSHGST